MARTWFRGGVLWLGILLCAYALWRSHGLAGEAISSVGMRTSLGAGGLLVLAWLLTVVTWQRYLQAYMGSATRWSVAARQVGLLLVGKYVPGGVFGFMARLYDQSGVSRLPLFWAGVIEQTVGVAMSVALGGVLFLAATRENIAWLLLLPALPLLAVCGAWMLHRSAMYIPWLRRQADASTQPAWPRLLLATVLQLGLLLTWAALVVLLATSLFGVDAYALLGLAGAFLLAVGAGMLVVIVPGGIGVRELALIGMASFWLGEVEVIFLTTLLRGLSVVLDVLAGVVAVIIGTKEVHD